MVTIVERLVQIVNNNNNNNINLTTLLLGIVVILVVWIFWKSHRAHRYWSDRNVPGPKPIPLLGNIDLFTRRKPNRCFGDQERLRKYGGKMYGYYFGTSPRLVLADVDLIRQLLIKDFHKCMNRQQLNIYHPAWDLNLFAAESDIWKRIRTIATPAFTTGRLRSMNGMMYRCARKLCNHLDTVVLSGNSGGGSGDDEFTATPTTTTSTSTTPKSSTGVIQDLKLICSCFTIDVIASIAFATDTNANNDRQNPFVINGMNFFNVKFSRVLLATLVPTWINTLLGIRTFIDPEPFEFFVQYSKEVIRQRLSGSGGSKASSPPPNDFVQLLIDARASVDAIVAKENVHQLVVTVNDQTNETSESANNNNNNNGSVPSTTTRTKQLTEDEIIAQCVLFFTAGFETTASTLFHCVHELARNLDIQQRLYCSLRETLENMGEDISSFNHLDNIDNANDDDDDVEASNKRLALLERLISADVSPYLEAVVKETLRKYPPIHLLFRRVTQDGYQLDGVPLDKDTLIEISVYAVHHNEKYYPTPERFDPDRFMPANKRNLVPYTYLPFGDGPRNCVGLRFAYQELKLALVMLVLAGYWFTPHRDTPVVTKFKTGGTPLLLTETFPICVSKRDSM